MSSLIGYTRLHVAHLSAVPFLTSVTGVLQLGQARISRSWGSTGMAELYDTSILLWNNSHMKGLVAAAIVAVSFSPARAAQAPANRTARAYAPRRDAERESQERHRAFRGGDRSAGARVGSERARHLVAALRANRVVRQGDSAADHARQRRARLAGRPDAARRSVRRLGPQ